MIEKGDKIRLELTRIENIEKIVQIENENQINKKLEPTYVTANIKEHAANI